MTEREIVAFSRALRKLGRGTTQITGSLDTAALIARESGRPIIWNALAPTGAVNQHGEFRYPHRETIARLDAAQPGRRRPRLRLGADRPVQVGDQSSRTTTSWTSSRHGRRRRLGTLEEKIAKFADPERRPKLKEAIDALGGGFGAARYPLAEITVNWISSDAPNAQELKERYEGFTIGEIAAREGKHLLDAMLDVAVAARLNAGFGTTMIDMDPQAVKEVGTSSVALPGISDGGAHTKFVTTARFATEVLGHWVREHELMSARGGASGGFPPTRRRRSASRTAASSPRARPADVIVYDPETVDAFPRSGCSTTPPANGGWSRRPRATTASSSTA